MPIEPFIGGSIPMPIRNKFMRQSGGRSTNSRCVKESTRHTLQHRAEGSGTCACGPMSLNDNQFSLLLTVPPRACVGRCSALSMPFFIYLFLSRITRANFTFLLRMKDAKQGNWLLPAQT